MISKWKELLKSDFVVAVLKYYIIIIIIQEMKDSERIQKLL